jgi:maltose alpha-D-glucosyltransferase/alpha-amylase
MPVPNDDATRELAQQLREWMPGQRWYGDKSRVIEQVTSNLIAGVNAGGVDVSLMDVHVQFEDGATSCYFVPVVQDGLKLADGMSRPEFLAWFAAGFRESRRLDLENTGRTLSWLPTGDAGWSLQEGSLVQSEQSNSSVLYGEVAVLKVFRRLQPGINPDSEIVSFLTRQGLFKHVPAFLGSVGVTVGDGSESIELAAVQDFVANEGDCWRWLPSALADGTSSLEDLETAVGLLGRRTGELHAALALGDEGAFAPAEIDVPTAERIRERLESEVQTTIPMLVRADVVDASEAEAFERALIAGVSFTFELVGTMRTRVHGDYHLGQVLKTGDDFVIIDFEGEPSRSMAERREMHSPLKDVAGMLRSIDYAVATARQSADGGRSDDLSSWKGRATLAFLDSYRSAVTSAPEALLPSDLDRFNRALDVYMIEKALYEVRYELDNRPDWIAIPFGALRDIVRGS